MGVHRRSADPTLTRRFQIAIESGILTATAIDGDLTVKSGSGNDTINTSGATVGGTKKINAGKGTNTVN